MLENKAEYDRMAKVEEEHWWYNALHERALKTILKNFKGKKDIEILDAGCGTGGLLLYLQKRGFDNLQGFDVSEFAIADCKSKNLPVFKASLTESATHFRSGTMDVIVCCDALYFLRFDEQKKALADFYKLLKSGGIIILNLPSLEIFRGIHDISVGIKKRYHHSILKELFPGEIVADGYSFVYWPMLLSPVIAVVRAFQRRKINSGKYEVKSDINLPGYLVNKLLKGLMKLEVNLLPAAINLGSSLFVVARKGRS